MLMQKIEMHLYEPITSFNQPLAGFPKGMGYRSLIVFANPFVFHHIVLFI